MKNIEYNDFRKRKQFTSWFSRETISLLPELFIRLFSMYHFLPLILKWKHPAKWLLPALPTYMHSLVEEKIEHQEACSSLLFAALVDYLDKKNNKKCGEERKKCKSKPEGENLLFYIVNS